MKVAIISDIHDHLPNLKKFLAFAKKAKVKILIVCGDTGNDQTLKFLNENFKGKVFLVSGNMDSFKIKYRVPLLRDEGEDEGEVLIAPQISNIKIFETVGEITIDGLKIAIAHFPEIAKKLALSRVEGYDFVFYGHSHKPWLEKIGGCFLANPGNLCGLLYRPSFAVLNTKTKNLTLKILEQL